MNKKLDRNGTTEQEFLAAYDITAFDQPSHTVDILLMTITENKVDNYRKLAKKALKILLIKRNEHPFMGEWALPGGFVRIDEDLETAAYRELKEETSVDNAYLEQLYTYGDVKRDPRGRIVSTSYISLVNKDEIKEKAGTDADDARWFEVSYKVVDSEMHETVNGTIEDQFINIVLTNEETILTSTVRVSRIIEGKHVSYQRNIEENNGLSFDHSLIIQNGLERLRNRLEYSDIIFHMMPTLFTLTDLQKSFEVILDKPLLKANFRRKISKMVSETEHSTSPAGHRPSQLFKFNPNWIK